MNQLIAIISFLDRKFFKMMYISIFNFKNYNIYNTNFLYFLNDLILCMQLDFMLDGARNMIFS